MCILIKYIRAGNLKNKHKYLLVYDQESVAKLNQQNAYKSQHEIH